MKYFIKIYALLVFALFAASCVKEEAYTPGGEEQGEKVEIELFTRQNSFNTPVTRAQADEYGVEKDPWVLVFKDNGSGIMANATYVEAARTFINVNNKSIVSLTPQAARCWVMIIANPQATFYIGSSSYSYSVANFKAQLTGASLGMASSFLLSEPLPAVGGVVSDVPFVGGKIPMSRVQELASGINTSTQIGSSATPLELTRSVAKLVVKSSVAPADFTLEGIVSVENMSRSTFVHNLTGALSVASPKVDYHKSNPNTTLLVVPSATTNVLDPVYVYEYKVDNANPGSLIVRANYKGTSYYYKLKLVDENEQLMDISRDMEYSFTITAVKGIGYRSYEDAKLSVAGNTQLDYLITVVHPDAYEIQANNDYYLAVSNRHCLIYDEGTGNQYVAFTIVTNCTTDFTHTKGNEMTFQNKTWIEPVYPAPTVAGTRTTRIPIATSKDTPRVTDVIVKLTSGAGAGLAIDPANSWDDAEVWLTLGNLKHTIKIKRKAIVPAAQTRLSYYVPGSYYYYLLSGKIDFATQAEQDNPWMLLTGSDGIYREDPTERTVEDGLLYVDVKENTTTSKRGAVVWLTTTKQPSYPAGDKETSPKRIKAYVHQAGKKVN